MKRINTAVIGLGRIGWGFHLPQIAQHSGFNLTAAADTSEECLLEAKEKYSVTGYTNYVEMYEKEKPDLVVIASPTLFHREQAAAAMERGIDVFLDKPMAVNLKEADEIIKVMDRTGRKLMVYQPHRVTAEFTTLQDILKRELIGRIYMIKRARSDYNRRNDWQALKKNGGGMLNNYGAHHIDQLLCLANSAVERITCSMHRIASIGDAEDVVKAVMETQNGVMLDLDINMAAAEPIPSWMVFGSHGTITLKKAGNREVFHVRYFNESELGELLLHSELAAPKRSYDNFEEIRWHEEEILVPLEESIDFYDKCYEYFALGEKPFIPVAETREVMRIINECRKDAGWD